MSEPPVPDCLTIEEAARVLRIGRTSAYSLAREWKETGGQAGIPYLEFGSSYRVPTAVLETMLGRPITHIPEPKPPSAARPKTETSGVPTDRAEPGRDAEVRALRVVGPRQPRRAPSAEGQGSLPL